MFQSPLSRRDLILAAFFSLFIIFFTFFNSWSDKTTKVVFCDVGQGDAAYLRLNNQIDILIDAGGDRSVLSCLGKYMPFYDRKIELAILSHPQIDHFGGFLYLLDRYQIDNFLMPKIAGSGHSFANLKKKIKAKGVSLSFPIAGETLKIAGDKIIFFWPREDFLKKNSVLDPKTDAILPVSSLDTNYFSLIFALEEQGKKILFTGDASPTVLNRLLQQSEVKSLILKIPHHGSKNGLTQEFLKLADPTFGVISVGKHNPYGHPAKEILQMLEGQKVIIRRTDKEGDIVFKLPK